MKSQKWSKSEALGSNNAFKDGLAEYYTVCSNKCILESFKLLANNVNIHFTWTQCILMITSCKLAYALLPDIVNWVRVCYISRIFLHFHWDFDNRHYFYTCSNSPALNARLPFSGTTPAHQFIHEILCFEMILSWMSDIYELFKSTTLFINFMRKSSLLVKKLGVCVALGHCLPYEK